MAIAEVILGLFLATAEVILGVFFAIVDVISGLFFGNCQSILMSSLYERGVRYLIKKINNPQDGQLAPEN